MQIPLSKQPPIQKKLKKNFRFSTPVILRGAARRSRRIHQLQVGKVLDSATSGIYALRAE